ncbi:MAG: hypothetical protein WCO96_07665 [Actinomycetes bacterium]
MSEERVLIVVTPSVTGEQLSGAVPPGELKGSDLKVVVPAVAGSALGYWFSDERAIERAKEAADRARDEIGGQAAAVDSRAGDCDPELAVHDALATFNADRIIVVHRSDHPGYREKKLDAERLEPRLHRRVDERLVVAG